MKSIPFLVILVLVTITSPGQRNGASAGVNSKPFVLGVTDEIESEVVGEKRVLNIYLPHGFDPNDTTRYAVIYLLDGSADEDFIHVAGIVQFYSFPWIDRIPPSIVVGIATVDRKRDFTFPTTVAGDKANYPAAGHSEQFISFIEKELQPYIEKKYQTTPLKTLVGQSLGGLLAAEILFKKPQLFNNYVLISPSLWWDNGSLLNCSPERLMIQNQRTHIYIAAGKEGLTPAEIPRVMEVDANLLAEKIGQVKNPLLQVTFDYLPAENHATIAHQAILNAFRTCFTGLR